MLFNYFSGSVLFSILLIVFNVFADDLVRTETGVDSVQAVYGLDGSRVIIAVLDRGIDYEHPDFLNDDSTTRILGIYDMLDPTGANDPNNPYGIGTLYTETDINNALASGVRLATRDAVGHGTASAGLAGGNGNASSGLYTGMAPGAKFLIVKITSEGAPAHGGEPAESFFYDPAYIPVAITYVKTEAAARNMPVVMLANFGSSGGPMDGRSELASTLDNEVGPGHPGVIFITGSSDDGGVDNHAAGTIAQGQTIDLEINKVTPFLRLDLWYDENDRFDVEIVTPSGTSGPYTSPATNITRDQQFSSVFNYFHNGSAVDFFSADNNKREIMIDFIQANGPYTVRLTGAQINDGSFHASLNPSTIFGGLDNKFTTFVVPGYTVWDLASAFNNITPNSYVLRPEWTDIDGTVRTFSGNEGGTGSLWAGSGIGPTYDGRTGITVSAPGNTNFTTYAPRSYFATLRFNLIPGGTTGQYGTLSAVSGAAPVLTGIVALMLQADSSLDASEVKAILESTARSDAFTGTTPNPTWGYGKVDAFAAVSSVLNPTGISSGNQATPRDFVLRQNYPNPFNPTTTITFVLPHASDVTLHVYDITGRKVRTLINGQMSAGSHQVVFEARDLTSGIYFYRLNTGKFVQTKRMLLIR